MKSLIPLFTIPLLFLMSCGTDSNAQVATTIQKEVATWSGVTNVETPEVTLIQELTGTDSLLLLNELIVFTNQDYNKQLTLLKANAQYLAKAKSKLYFANGQVNQYYKNECDARIAEMKKICSEINTFADGLAGKYEINRGHIFKPYNDLKSKKNVVLANVYKATLKYHVPRYYSGRGSGTMPKTEMKYFFLSPDGSHVLKSAPNFEMQQGPQVEFIKFERYSVDDTGSIKIVSSSTETESNETAIVAKYRGSEFIGYCNVVFETEAGEEIYFIDPKLGEFASENCGMKDEFVGKKFSITYSKDEINVHTEEGNEIIETEVIQKIELIK
jgi:hypothetical protein